MYQQSPQLLALDPQAISHALGLTPESTAVQHLQYEFSHTRVQPAAVCKAYAYTKSNEVTKDASQQS